VREIALGALTSLAAAAAITLVVVAVLVTAGSA
jgi:hypothetical protein